MTNSHLFGQLSGLLLLFSGVWWGYRRWVMRHQVNRSQRSLLLLIILTLIGGFVGSFGWWLDVPASFAWDLPPLAARMLAAAGWSFAVACWLVLERPSPSRLRLIILMLFIYLVPLAIAIVLFHLDRFDWTAPISYAFFALVVPMAAVTIWHLFHPTSIIQGASDAPVTGMARGWLWGTAVLTALWGLALFLTDDGGSSLIWAWPGDLLTSRLIAVMLWTVAGAAVYTLYSQNALRITLAVMLTYGIGVVVANVWNMAAIKHLYVSLFALLALGAAILLSQTQNFVAEGKPDES
jgi:hypothetical protein